MPIRRTPKRQKPPALRATLVITSTTAKFQKAYTWRPFDFLGGWSDPWKQMEASVERIAREGIWRDEDRFVPGHTIELIEIADSNEIDDE